MLYGNGIVKAFIEFKNYGQTPAHALIFKYKMEIQNAGQFLSFLTALKFTAICCSTNLESTLAHFIPITPTEIFAINGGQKNIHIWGLVSYSDEFGGSAKLGMAFY